MLSLLNKKAFTLTELMIAVVIFMIMVLLGSLEIGYGPPPNHYNIQKDNQREIKKAIEHFYSQNGRYPTSLNEFTNVSHPYFSEIPIDPFTGKADWELREKEPQDKWYANPISESGYPGSPAIKWIPNKLSGIFDIRPRQVK